MSMIYVIKHFLFITWLLWNWCWQKMHFVAIHICIYVCSVCSYANVCCLWDNERPWIRSKPDQRWKLLTIISRVPMKAYNVFSSKHRNDFFVFTVSFALLRLTATYSSSAAITATTVITCNSMKSSQRYLSEAHFGQDKIKLQTHNSCSHCNNNNNA